MGSGKANIDVPLIMRIAALIFCAVALGLNVASTSTNSSGQSNRAGFVSNSLAYSVFTYIFIIAFFFLIPLIFKLDVEEKLHMIALICGFIWTIGAGIGVIIFVTDYGHQTLQLVSGILALVAGIVMLIDALHIGGVF